VSSTKLLKSYWRISSADEGEEENVLETVREEKNLSGSVPTFYPFTTPL